MDHPEVGRGGVGASGWWSVRMSRSPSRGLRPPGDQLVQALGPMYLIAGTKLFLLLSTQHAGM